jgi:glycosyltransferase involved in cell wall biosynthesis
VNQPRSDRARVLFLARAYPNRMQPLHGLWVRQHVTSSTAFCEPKVLSPVPWCPPIPGMGDEYRLFRRVERTASDEGIEVLHPRFLVGPGLRFAPIEATTYLASALPAAARLRRRFPFDLVHAHFTYPDGVAAVALGRRYSVPVIITEQVPWRPWLDGVPAVRRQAVWAAQNVDFHVAISRVVKEQIEHFTGPSDRIRVVPNAVDETIFTLAPNGVRPVPNRVLFVGAIRRVKGVDVLLHAMRILKDHGRDVELVLVGEGLFKRHRDYQGQMVQMAAQLGLADRVDFAGPLQGSELAAALHRSAVLVLPSRAESLGVVLVEALACGIPVVATRCGGPEEIVDDRFGELVTPEDPDALADGIAHVLDNRSSYDPAVLREHAIARFGASVVAEQMRDIYAAALQR